MASNYPRPGGEEAPQRVDSAVLRIDRVFKRFGGTQALSDVSMAVGRGEVVALLGENGAGKSTLIKILAGVYTVDSGTISYAGNDMTSAVRRMPVSFIHQDLGLIDWMTVTENICLTLGYPRRFGLIEWSRARKLAERRACKDRRRYRSGFADPGPHTNGEIAGRDRACARNRSGDPHSR